MFQLYRFPAFLAALVTLVVLAGCADTELPKWLSNEPTKAELEAYKGPVAMPPVGGVDAPSPNLADVPEAPVVSSLEEVQAEIDLLRAENARGAAAISDYSVGKEKSAPPIAPKAAKKSKKKRKTAK